MEQQIKIDITQTTPINCKCGSNIFQEILMLRKASRFISNLPTDQIIPAQVIACVQCGELQEDLLPSSLKMMLDKEKEYIDVIEETK
jgi:hypothetical protein